MIGSSNKKNQYLLMFVYNVQLFKTMKQHIFTKKQQVKDKNIVLRNLKK